MGLDGVDALADDAVDLRDRPGSLDVRRGHVPPDEERPQAGGRPEQRVAFGHRGRSSALSAEGEAAIAGHEPRLEQRRPRRRRGDVLAVRLADHELAEAAGSDERGQPAHGHGGDRGVVERRQRLERGAAALQVQRGDPVDEHDVRPGCTLQRPPVVLAAPRPGERRAIRVGRIRGGQQVDGGLARALGIVANGPQSIEGTGQRELRRPEPVDEVPAPDRPASSIARRTGYTPEKPPSLASAITASRVRTPCRSSWARAWACSRSVAVTPSTGSTSDQRPAASGGPSAVRRPARGRRGPAAREPSGRFQRSARSGAKVSLVTSPAHTRSHSASSTSRSGPATGCPMDLAVERRATRGEMLADPLVPLVAGPFLAIGRRGRRPERVTTGPEQGDPPVVPTEAPPPPQPTSPMAPSSSRSRGW